MNTYCYLQIRYKLFVFLFCEYSTTLTIALLKYPVGQWTIGLYLPLPYLAIARNPVESYYASRAHQIAVGLFRCERNVAKGASLWKGSRLISRSSFSHGVPLMIRSQFVAVIRGRRFYARVLEAGRSRYRLTILC